MRILLAAIICWTLAGCALHKSDSQSAAADCAVPDGLVAMGNDSGVYLNTDSHFSQYRHLTITVEPGGAEPEAMPAQWDSLIGQAVASEWRERFGLTEAAPENAQTVHLRSQVRVLPPSDSQRHYALEIRAWLSDSSTAQPVLFSCTRPLALPSLAGEQPSARDLTEAAMRWSARVGSHLMAAG